MIARERTPVVCSTARRGAAAATNKTFDHLYHASTVRTTLRYNPLSLDEAKHHRRIYRFSRRFEFARVSRERFSTRYRREFEKQKYKKCKTPETPATGKPDRARVFAFNRKITHRRNSCLCTDKFEIRRLRALARAALADWRKQRSFANRTR